MFAKIMKVVFAVVIVVVGGAIALKLDDVYTVKKAEVAELSRKNKLEEQKVERLMNQPAKNSVLSAKHVGSRHRHEHRVDSRFARPGISTAKPAFKPVRYAVAPGMPAQQPKYERKCSMHRLPMSPRNNGTWTCTYGCTFVPKSVVYSIPRSPRPVAYVAGAVGEGLVLVHR